MNKGDPEDEREKVLVPVHRRKDIQEEELQEVPEEQEVREVPRRWYVY